MNEQEWLASTDPAAMLGEIQRNGVLRQGQTPSGVWCWASDRKLRLFACACCRLVWDKLPDDARCERCAGRGYRVKDKHGHDYEIRCSGCRGSGRVNRSRRAVEVAERYADGLCDFPALAAAERAAMDAWMGFPENNPRGMARYCCIENVTYAAERITRPGLDGVVHAIQANLLRDIVGNPFRPVTLPYSVPVTDLFRVGPSVSTDQVATCPWLTPTVLSLATAAYRERERKCEKCDKGWRPKTGTPDAGMMSRCPDCHGTGRTDDGTLDPARLAVLSDALVDAGCDDPDILQPLRGLERCGRCGGLGRIRPYPAWPAQNPCPDCHSTGWRKADRPRFRGFHVLDTIRGVTS